MDYKRIIESFGYLVCTLPSNKIAVSDPLDNEDGFYLEADSHGEAYREMKDLGLLTKVTIDKRDEDTHENKFSMQYVCPDDGTRWTVEWSCACNDKCPTCNKEIEPSEVEDLD